MLALSMGVLNLVVAAILIVTGVRQQMSRIGYVNKVEVLRALKLFPRRRESFYLGGELVKTHDGHSEFYPSDSVDEAFNKLYSLVE